jgi:hypothetical protein
VLLRSLLSVLALLVLALVGVAGVVATAVGIAGLGLLLTHRGIATERYWLESSLAIAGGIAAVVLATAGLFRSVRRGPPRGP